MMNKTTATVSLVVAVGSLLFLTEPFTIVAAGPIEPVSITMLAEVYKTKRATAEPLLRGEKVDAEQLAAALAKMAQGFNSATTVTRLPAVTGLSQQRNVVQGKDTVLEVQAVVSPNGQIVTVNAALKVGEKNLTTAGNTKFGGTLFLGSIDAGQDNVHLAFIRVLKHQ